MGLDWSSLPLDRVVRVLGAPTGAFELTTESLPADAPAILTYYPRSEPTTMAVVESLLRRLEESALDLYPEWLPGAEEIDDAAGSGVAAVRALAMRMAAHTAHFGPFLADLAEQALRGRGKKVVGYPPEVRAPSLARVVAASYDRRSTAILIDVPDAMTPAAQEALAGACEWLVAKGGFGIWVCGPGLPDAEHVHTVRLELPTQVAQIVEAADASSDQEKKLDRGRVFFPPIAGKPRHNSPAEKLLEAALLRLAWAKGRIWNRPYPKRPEFVIDLIWTDERCAVEIDGPDHRRPLKFAKDRRRDVLLHLDGYAVLRFTNDRITDELDQVLAELKQFLEQQRLGRR
ncbi:MAG TPA: DUF559 domain-containing protein [Candidatus Limnocylindrales bacterium]|nr:DUF559 domain-containing protein [Candidatus Limnocylindrales bacterium]